MILLAGLDEDVKSAAADYGERLSGVVFNKVPRYRDVYADRAVAALNDDGVPCLGWLPEDRRLAANTVDSLVDHLEGQLAFDVNTTSELVDNVLIGGPGAGLGTVLLPVAGQHLCSGSGWTSRRANFRTSERNHPRDGAYGW